MTATSYGIGLSNAWSDESRRLAALEAMFDPGTFRHLERLGVGAGMRCLEIGGGGGSVARWMGERVGSTGSVLVTDIDVSGLAACEAPNIEVRVHDICTDPLEAGSFDVIHARLVLEHLPTRLEVIAKLVWALRRGGWLLLEDFDFSEWLYMPEERLLCEPYHLRTPQRRAQAGASGGPWDGEFGRDLPVHLVAVGLDQVGGEACCPLLVGGTPEADYHTLSLRHVGPVLVEAGFLSQQEVEEAIAAFEKPGAMASLYKMVSAWGRRPT